MTYDSTEDTNDHIRNVQRRIQEVRVQLDVRAAWHDASKLAEPEKSAYDLLGELIPGKMYGTPEYNAVMDDPRIKDGIQHHVTTNSHHPQAHANGVNDMTLLDLVEMFCDIKAASERSTGKPLADSLAYSCQRWGISEQLAGILENTRKELNW